MSIDDHRQQLLEHFLPILASLERIMQSLIFGAHFAGGVTTLQVLELLLNLMQDVVFFEERGSVLTDCLQT